MTVRKMEFLAMFTGSLILTSLFCVNASDAQVVHEAATVSVILPADLVFTNHSQMPKPSHPSEAFETTVFAPDEFGIENQVIDHGTRCQLVVESDKGLGFQSQTVIDFSLAQELEDGFGQYAVLAGANQIRKDYVKFDLSNRIPEYARYFVYLRVRSLEASEDLLTFNVVPSIRYKGRFFFPTFPELWRFKDGVFILLDPARGWSSCN